MPEKTPEKAPLVWPGARRPFWMLFLIAAPLAEILSGNVPVLSFLRPGVFIPLTLFYGLPVVLIREFAVIYELNTLGIILLGLGYGLLNEGVLAKTLSELSGPPVGHFAGYGQIGPFQTGWAIFIVFWHALHSVLYPILITHWTWPGVAGKRWLSRRGLKLTVPALAALYPMHFVLRQRPPVPLLLVCYIVATALLVLLAVRLCRERTRPAPALGRPSLKPVFIGMATIVFYVCCYVMAAKRPPFALYALLSLSVIAFAIWRMAQAGWRPVPEVLLFGLGDDVSFSALAGIGAVAAHNAPLQHAAAAVAFCLLFTFLIRSVRRHPRGSNAAPRRRSGSDRLR